MEEVQDERQEKKEEKTNDRKRKRGRSMERLGRRFFLMMMIGQSLGEVHAALDNAKNRENNMEVSQCESKTTVSSWVQMKDQ